MAGYEKDRAIPYFVQSYWMNLPVNKLQCKGPGYKVPIKYCFSYMKMGNQNMPFEALELGITKLCVFVPKGQLHNMKHKKLECFWFWLLQGPCIFDSSLYLEVKQHDKVIH